jgi:hypothetical protein
MRQTHRNWNLYLPVAAILSGMLLVASTRASQVRPLNLEEMTDRAAVIFVGRCLEVTEQGHPQLRRVTRVTFQVEQPVKGRVGQRVTIEMPGRSSDSLSGLHIAGVPEFKKGDEVLLFLYGKSKLGLSVPVGLGQGRFTIRRDKLGLAVGVNDFGNRAHQRGLYKPALQKLGPSAPTQSHAERGLDSASLVQITRELIALQAGLR